MRRLGITITLGLMLVGTAASAQTISNLQYSATSSYVFPFAAQTFTDVNGAGSTAVGSATSPLAGFFGRTEFDSYVIGGDGSPISFESAAIATGRAATSVSSTQVSFTFENAGSSDITFQSQITPAGLGFYLGDTVGCALSDCAEVIGPNVLDIKRYNPLLPSGLVGFDFSIQDNGEDLFRVSGLSSIVYDRRGNASFLDLFGTGIFGDGTGARGLLAGFESAYPLGEAAAHGFHWDATDVFFDLGQGTHNLSYSTTVFAVTNAKTLSCGANLIGYSGFGDPIGRGGGASAFRGAGPGFGASATSSECPHDTADMAGPGLTFTPATFEEPTISNGRLVFNTTGVAVPEPATWAMLIMGFGGIGAALRRRRTLGAPA